MTELQYLLLADSVYLDLKVEKTLKEAVDIAEYKDRNRNERILTFAKSADLTNMKVVATRKLSNGFYATAVKYGDELVFAYRGTDTSFDQLTNLNIAIGANAPTQFTDAVDFYNETCNKYLNAKVSITGHSLGGGLAQYVGVMGTKEPLKVVGFSSIGISGLLSDNRGPVRKMRIYNAKEFS